MGAPTSLASPLDLEKVLALLDDDGPISRYLTHFEARPEQKEMLAKIVDAFNSNAVALLEAGTGTGKSIAYLIPALLAAAIWKERVVISTHTISLQEQIILKDLPLLIKALGVESKAVLVKGMSNYVCLRKLEELEFEKRMMPESDQNSIDQIDSWCKRENLGSRSDLPQNPSHAIWDLVHAEYDTCNGAECPHYQNCYYVQARKKAADADLLIVNHHLLLTDLIVRSENQNYQSIALLPAYTRIILDEAHNLEEIATDYFATRFSRLEILKSIARLSSEKQGAASGKLQQIKMKAQKHLNGDFSTTTSRFLNRLTLDLPALRRELIKSIHDTFDSLQEFQQLLQTRSDTGEENKLRLLEGHYLSKPWQEKVLPKAQELISYIKRYAVEINQLETHVKDLGDERMEEALKSALFDTKALSKRLEKEAECLKSFLEKPRPGSTRWIEQEMTKNGLNISLIDATLDIATLFAKTLFQPFDSVVMLSATLTTQGSFDYIKERMGLAGDPPLDRPLIEARYDSPFDYERQALLLIPKDLPSPTDKDFLKAAEKLIWEAIEASRGNAFILFTSYGMLNRCYQTLEAKLKEQRYHPLKQGAESRHQLLRRFQEKDRSVLFGTDSFWEGVDVAGEALRLVIITKLPFKVPSEPMVQARCEAILEKGGDPFYEYQLPLAAIKFKQGFGRLIRNKKDRGCILCLDNRLINKPYGAYFFKTLPNCPRAILNSDELIKQMRAFYRWKY